MWKLRQAQAVWDSRFEYRRYLDLAFCSLGNLTVINWYCYNVSLNYLPIVPFILNSQGGEGRGGEKMLNLHIDWCIKLISH